MPSEGQAAEKAERCEVYLHATQLVHQLIKRLEHLGLAERREGLLAGIKGLNVSDEIRERLLREFG
jgi:hypothetical protein